MRDAARRPSQGLRLADEARIDGERGCDRLVDAPTPASTVAASKKSNRGSRIRAQLPIAWTFASPVLSVCGEMEPKRKEEKLVFQDDDPKRIPQTLVDAAT